MADGYLTQVSQLNDMYRIDTSSPERDDVQYEATHKRRVPFSTFDGLSPKELKSIVHEPDWYGVVHKAPKTAAILRANPWAFGAVKPHINALSDWERMITTLRDNARTAGMFAARIGGQLHEGILQAAALAATLPQVPSIAERATLETVGGMTPEEAKMLNLWVNPVSSAVAAASQKATHALTGAEQYLKYEVPGVYNAPGKHYGVAGKTILRAANIAPSLIPMVLFPEATIPLSVGMGAGQEIQAGNVHGASATQILGAGAAQGALYGLIGDFGAGKLVSGLAGRSVLAKVVGATVSGATRSLSLSGGYGSMGRLIACH